jgi:hypothetical protein
MRSLIEAAVGEIVTQLACHGMQASFEPKDNVFSLDGKGVTVTIGAARSLCEAHAGKRWRVRTNRGATTQSIWFRMDERNSDLMDYYFLPTSEIIRTRVKKCE